MQVCFIPKEYFLYFFLSLGSRPTLFKADLISESEILFLIDANSFKLSKLDKLGRKPAPSKTAPRLS